MCEHNMIKVELTLKVYGYQSTGRSAMCEHNMIKVELTLKVYNCQSTGRSAMSEHNMIKVELTVLQACVRYNALFVARSRFIGCL